MVPVDGVAPIVVASIPFAIPAVDTAPKETGAAQPASQQAALNESQAKEIVAKAKETGSATKAKETDSAPKAKEPDASAKTKEQDTVAKAKELDSKASQAATPPMHRHTASLRYIHHPTRQAAVKISTRSMRDTPD
jgi:hypothetical protein